MTALNLAAEKRTETGKNACSRLRRAGKIPAVVYSHGTAEAVQVDSKAFKMLFKGRISESVLFDLNFKSGEPVKVYVKDYVKHPVSEEVMHLDFYRITFGEKIHTKVSVEFVGSSIGQRKGGVFEQLEREIEIHVLPRELPEKITIDIANLDIDQSIRVKDIKGPASMTVAGDPEHVIAHVIAARVEEGDTASAE